MNERSIFSQKVHQGRPSTRRLISNAAAAVPTSDQAGRLQKSALAKSAPPGMPAVSWSIGH
jgi:hypothetical protein